MFDLFKGAGTFIGALKASLLASVFPLLMQNVANAQSPKKRFFLWLFLLEEGGGFAGPGGTVILLYYCMVTQGHLCTLFNVLLIALNETFVITQWVTNHKPICILP